MSFRISLTAPIPGVPADVELQGKGIVSSFPATTQVVLNEQEVVLDSSDDPKSMSLARKWSIISIIASAALCATFASSVAAFAEAGIAEDLHTTHEVSILSVSLYALGLGFGPLVFGPMSELYGRTIIYRISYFLFWVFTWPVAFAPNIAVLLVFRFVTGFCSSAFLSVVGGSISDMFTNAEVATPMGVFTLAPLLGPVLGPIIGGIVNQYVNWRWSFRLLLIWEFVELFFLVLFVPETYGPKILKRKARRLRKDTGDSKYYAPLERTDKSLWGEILFNCYTPFLLVIYDRMALLLNIWVSLILGIMYILFEAFPIVFQELHGFNDLCTGLAFSGIGLGMILALVSGKWWNRYQLAEHIRYNGAPPPEVRLVMGQVGGILTAVSLFMVAFTSYRQVHWIAPILVSTLFGAGSFYIFTSTLTYLVITFRPIAASAVASNSAMRSTFSAAFPLFAGAMYKRLGIVGATALLAGLCTIMAPLPFIFYRIGPRLRATSRYAAK